MTDAEKLMLLAGFIMMILFGVLELIYELSLRRTVKRIPYGTAVWTFSVAAVLIMHIIAG